MGSRFTTAWLAPLLLSPLFICVQADEPAAPTAAKDTAAAPACDVVLGKRVFGQCSICHSLEKGAAPIAGPNLHGIVGRAAASANGFNYSKALREAAKQWTPAELDRYLEQPTTYAPGTMMAFAGLKKPEERAAVICYIASVSE